MKTNGDRIRTMTDEEMSNRLSKVICPNVSEECCHTSCKECWLSWLKAPVEDGEGNEKLLDDVGTEQLFRGEYCTDEEIELILEAIKERSVATGVSIYDCL